MNLSLKRMLLRAPLDLIHFISIHIPHTSQLVAQDCSSSGQQTCMNNGPPCQASSCDCWERRCWMRQWTGRCLW